jgi:hypothetical protein
MKPIYPVTYLISANELDLLKNDLKAYNIDSKQVLGAYTMENGVKVEEPALVLVTNQETLIKSLAFKYNQESVLKLDATRNAELLFTDGRTKYIGQFQAVSKEVALKSKGYTFDESQGVYYTCL